VAATEPHSFFEGILWFGSEPDPFVNRLIALELLQRLWIAGCNRYGVERFHVSFASWILLQQIPSSLQRSLVFTSISAKLLTE